MTNEPVLAPSGSTSLLTAAEFHRLAAVPAEAEWFANLQNRQTWEAYRRDVGDFTRFVGISRPEDFWRNGRWSLLFLHAVPSDPRKLKKFMRPLGDRISGASAAPRPGERRIWLELLPRNSHRQ